MYHPVLHALEVVQAIKGTHVGLQAVQLQWFADGLANVVADHVVTDLRVVLDTDRGDHRGALAGRARGQQFAVAGLRALEHCQARVQGARGSVTGVDHVLGPAEIGDAEARQGGLDEDVVAVQGRQLLLGVTPGHESD
ncbi:hypothetical protein D9M71_600670 [compost metagenome]